jgi:hypothetical protein
MYSFLPMIQAWREPQVNLEKVFRWKKYLNNSRPQNSLQHSHAITLLGSMVLVQLRPSFYSPLDEALVLTALSVHDVGEGQLGFDTLYIDKNDLVDVDEYLAFKHLYQNLPLIVYHELEKAFLLQFALKNSDKFPLKAQEKMKILRREKRFEALAFEAIERLDYVFYAFDQFSENDNKEILVQTLRHQLSHLEYLGEKLPGFCNIWSWAESDWTRDFLEKNKGLWIEEKS